LAIFLFGISDFTIANSDKNYGPDSDYNNVVDIVKIDAKD
jgi:hypothetical protein